MISPTIHPRTLPFDRIVNTTYSLFHNNIFRRMATSLELPEPRIDPAHTLQLDHHMQNTIGDTLHNKETTTFRILGQNANGISPRNNFSKWNEILQSTITHDVDVLCLSETNVEWRHHHVSARLEAITKKFFRHSRLTTASSSIKFERMFKPGGTATLITNEWTGRILKCESDPSGLGRWTTAMLTGKQHRKIAIISAYQVCQTSITTCGLTTCFSQQWHLLRAQGDVTPSPRERFWTDLTRYIQGLNITNTRSSSLAISTQPREATTIIHFDASEHLATSATRWVTSMIPQITQVIPAVPPSSIIVLSAPTFFLAYDTAATCPFISSAIRITEVSTSILTARRSSAARLRKFQNQRLDS